MLNIKKLLTQILLQMAVKSTSLTALGKTWYFYRIGRIGIVQAFGDMRTASSGTNSVGTLSAEFRPVFSSYFGVQNSTANMFLIMAPAGTVNFYSDRAVSSATNCGIYGVYITAS